MEVTSIASVLAMLREIGPAGLLAIALIGLHRRWWVPGWVYRERVTFFEQEAARERDRSEKWMAHALSNLELAERATDTLERIHAEAAR